MAGRAYYRDPTRLIDSSHYMFYKEMSDRDFEFKLNANESIQVHKLIVKHSSDVFRSKFEDWDKSGLTSVQLDIKVIGPNALSAKVFKIFLQYIYTGSFNYKELDDENMLELLALADEFGFFNLASEMGQAVSSRDYLNIWNVWYFYMAAGQYELQELHDSCIKFVDTHAIEVLNNEACFELVPAMFKNIISRDTLFATEIEILKPLVRFLIVKQSSMSKDMASDLLSNIRWSFITESEFDELVKPTGMVDMDFYKNAHEKKEMQRFNTNNPRPNIRLDRHWD